MTDGTRLAGMLEAVGADLGSARAVVLNIEPHSQGRPRADARGKHVRIHKDDADIKAEQVTADLLRLQRFEPMTGNCAVVAIFYRASAQTVDGDNLIKHLLDAAHGVLFENDRQVTGMACLVELDREHPRTCLAIAPHSSSLLRGTDRLQKARATA